jgi:hypothetical protein
MTDIPSFDPELLATVRAAQHAFVRRIDPLRPDLHLVQETDVRYRAQAHDIDSEPMLLLFDKPHDGGDEAAVADILRVETADGAVAADPLVLLLSGDAPGGHNPVGPALPDPRLPPWLTRPPGSGCRGRGRWWLPVRHARRGPPQICRWEAVPSKGAYQHDRVGCIATVH